jgi:Uma2 family endonuclease
MICPFLLKEQTMSTGNAMLTENFLITAEAYLKGEIDADVKHEYVNGRVFAMTGASRKHNLITGNIFAILHSHLSGSSCQVFMNDMKAHVKTSSDECFYYPDVMVTCQPGTEDYFENTPTLVVEVLSKSTERYDREGKFLNYVNIESLSEYILIHQDLQTVEIYRRRNNWEPEYFGIDINSKLQLESVDLSTDVAAFYNGT